MKIVKVWKILWELMIGVSIIFIQEGCSLDVGEHGREVNWETYYGIYRYMEITSEAIRSYRIIWDSFKEKAVPTHVSKVFAVHKLTKDGYTIHMIYGVEGIDTLILNYWAYTAGDTSYGYVEFINDTMPWSIEVKLYTNKIGLTEEYGKISGLHGYAIYIGALVNDTTVHGIWSYHSNQSSATFDDLVDINSPELPGVVYELSAYVDSSGFVNNNFSPIPVEIVNEMAEEILDTSIKADPALLSDIGAWVTGMALGAIYGPGAVGYWASGAGSLVYGLINYLITGG